MKKSNSNFTTNSAITFTAIAAGFVFAWGMSGAGKSTVQGIVQLDGQSVPWANVVFVPEDRSVNPIAVKANEEGRYQLNGDLPAGPYRIIARGAVKNDSARNDRIDELDDYQQQMVLTSNQQESKIAKVIPESYGQIETSPLQAHIVEGESIQVDLDLTTQRAQLAESKTNNSTTLR